MVKKPWQTLYWGSFWHGLSPTLRSDVTTSDNYLVSPCIEKRVGSLHKLWDDPFCLLNISIMNSFQECNQTKMKAKWPMSYIGTRLFRCHAGQTTKGLRKDFLQSIEDTIVKAMTCLAAPKVHKTCMTCSSYPRAPHLRKVDRGQNTSKGSRHGFLQRWRTKIHPILSCSYEGQMFH